MTSTSWMDTLLTERVFGRTHVLRRTYFPREQATLDCVTTRKESVNLDYQAMLESQIKLADEGQLRSLPV
jgi:hypothetical protein